MLGWMRSPLPGTCSTGALGTGRDRQLQEQGKPPMRLEGLSQGSGAGAPEPLSGRDCCPGTRRDGAGAELRAAPLRGAGPSPSIMLSELLRRLLSTFMSAWRACNIWQLDRALIRGL